MSDFLGCQVASDIALDELLAERVNKKKDKEPFVRQGMSKYSKPSTGRISELRILPAWDRGTKYRETLFSSQGRGLVWTWTLELLGE